MSSGPAQDAIEAVLDGEIRPALSAHAGGIDLVSVAGGRVELRFRGSCGACYFRRSCVANLVRPTLEERLGAGFEYHVGAG